MSMRDAFLPAQQPGSASWQAMSSQQRALISAASRQPEEIATWDIDVMPDGRFLPPGSGNPQQGHAVYVEKCQSCHGEKGNDGFALPLIGGVGTIGKNEVKPLRTIGSYWPYRRASSPISGARCRSTNQIAEQ